MRILDSSVGLWVGIQSAEDLVFQTSQLRVLRSAQEDNMSLIDSNIAYLCQSITIDNHRHVCMYVRKILPF